MTVRAPAWETGLRSGVLAGVGLLLLTPFVVSTGTIFPFVVGKALWSRSVIEVVFALWAVLALASPAWRPPRSRVLAALAAGLAVSLLAACFGASLQRSLWSSYERMQGVVDGAHWMALAVVLASVLRTGPAWRRLLAASAGAGAAMACLIIALYHGMGVPLYSALAEQHLPRMSGPLGNPIYLSALPAREPDARAGARGAGPADAGAARGLRRRPEGAGGAPARRAPAGRGPGRTRRPPGAGAVGRGRLGGGGGAAALGAGARGLGRRVRGPVRRPRLRRRRGGVPGAGAGAPHRGGRAGRARGVGRRGRDQLRPPRPHGAARHRASGRALRRRRAPAAPRRPEPARRLGGGSRGVRGAPGPGVGAGELRGGVRPLRLGLRGRHPARTTRPTASWSRSPRPRGRRAWRRISGCGRWRCWPCAGPRGGWRAENGRSRWAPGGRWRARWRRASSCSTRRPARCRPSCCSASPRGSRPGPSRGPRRFRMPPRLSARCAALFGGRRARIALGAAAVALAVGGLTVHQRIHAAADVRHLPTQQGNWRAVAGGIEGFPPLANTWRWLLFNVLGENWPRLRAADAAGARDLLDWVSREAAEVVRTEPRSWRIQQSLARLYRAAAATDAEYAEPARRYLERARALAPERAVFPVALRPPDGLACGKARRRPPRAALALARGRGIPRGGGVPRRRPLAFRPPRLRPGADLVRPARGHGPPGSGATASRPAGFPACAALRSSGRPPRRRRGGTARAAPAGRSGEAGRRRPTHAPATGEPPCRSRRGPGP